jgi:hypothetical protein
VLAPIEPKARTVTLGKAIAAPADLFAGVAA